MFVEKEMPSGKSIIWIETFAKVAKGLGFNDEETKILVKSDDLNSHSFTDGEVVKSLSQLVALATLRGPIDKDKWLNSIPMIDVSEELKGKSLREIIFDVPGGLDIYVANVETAGGGPLLPYVGPL